MRFSLTRVTAPTVNPVTLAETKAHLRVDGSDDDTRIAAIIAAATQHFDGWDGTLGRALVTQTWDLKLDFFPRRVWLPLPPLQSVTSVTYQDLDGATQTLASSAYRVVNQGNDQSFLEEEEDEDWPSTNDERDAVTVRFVAGYASEVPQPIKHAILFRVQALYDTCDMAVATALENAQRALTTPYRVHNQFPR
jgi:uncharacterized phiE125 gp8 family phage protein